MCSRQPEEGAGADRIDEDSPWTHTPHTLPADKPRWVKRAVNGGWDQPQEDRQEVIDRQTQALIDSWQEEVSDAGDR